MWNFAFYNPSVLLRKPPPFTQGRLITARQYTSKVQHTIPCRARHVKKDRKYKNSLSFLSVGANCVRTRAFTERPYNVDFAAGKTCFMEDTTCVRLFYFGGPEGSRSCFLLDALDLIFCSISQKASVTVHKTTHRVVLLTAFDSLY